MTNGRILHRDKGAACSSREQSDSHANLNHNFDAVDEEARDGHGIQSCERSQEEECFALQYQEVGEEIPLRGNPFAIIL